MIFSSLSRLFNRLSNKFTQPFSRPKKRPPDGPFGTPYELGDLVWVKRHHPDSLEPHWQGPYTAILSTPTAIKVAGKRPWIHHTQLKRAFMENSDKCWTIARPEANREPSIKVRLKRVSI
jgi:hypothetical protein